MMAEHSMTYPTIKQRVKAVRGEVINALSFLSVVWSLHDEESGTLATVFVVIGLGILIIDCYFIYCQWMMMKNHAIYPCKQLAFLCNRNRKNSSSRSTSSNVSVVNINSMDDLLSDLPQVIWLLGYIYNFKPSLIATICATNSGLALLEDLIGIREEKTKSINSAAAAMEVTQSSSPLSSSSDEEMQKLNY